MVVNILKKHNTYTFAYPKAIEFAEQQTDIFWTDREIALEKDLHDLKTRLSETELHGVITVLKLFTEYELRVGGNYWLGRMMKIFHRPELQRMCATFGAVELNVHAPFYAKINELLGLNTDEFYASYKSDETLRDRIKFIESVTDRPINNVFDILISIGVGSIIEGAILYSNFAFLKHFQAEGKNLLPNLVAGINFSVRDEHLHSIAGAWLFRQLLSEAGLSDEEKKNLNDILVEMCDKVAEHENIIISKIFDKGNIRGITDLQLRNFVQSRLDLCMQQLGFSPIYNVSYNPIAHWFYKNIQSNQLHDFFYKVGNSYNRDWSEKKFGWDISEGA